MLKKRLIPKLLLKFKENNKLPILVNSYKYSHYKTIGDPISQAKIYEAQSADELVILNIDSLDLQNNKFVLSYLKEFSKNIFMPLTFGGGVKSVNCFNLLLNSGADKVSINTNAVLKPNLISEGAKNFGSQCVVVSIDFKKLFKFTFGTILFSRSQFMLTITIFEPLISSIEFEQIKFFCFFVANKNFFLKLLSLTSIGKIPEFIFLDISLPFIFDCSIPVTKYS